MLMAMPSTAQVRVRNAERPSGELFSSPGKRSVISGLSLILLSVAVYFPVGRNGFINFDDNHYITDNPQVSSPLTRETVKWAFTTFDAANWHPLTWISHALDYHLFGLNAAGHHFESVLIHALNVVLLFLVLQALTGFTWRSLVVASLFAVHPLNVESVAWAAERKTVLSMLFLLLALWAYARYIRRPSVGRYSLVVAVFASALMSKPQVITFPFVLLLLDYWPLRRSHWLPASNNHGSTDEPRSFLWLVAEKIPLFVLSAASALITLRAQHAGNAVRTAAEYSWALRVENALVSYVLYFRDVFFPHHLAPIYPHPTALFPFWKVIAASGLLLTISAMVVLARKQAPYLIVGWLWFLGTLVPMIGLVQVGLQARADRYMYVAIIGVLVALVWGTGEVVNRYKFSTALTATLCAFPVLGLSVATYRQVSFWRDSETLWNYTMSVTHDNFMAEDNLAQELAHQGRTEEALIHFHHILNLHDWSASDLISFGVYEQHNGYAGDAIKQYQRALATAQDSSTRVLALSDIASAYLDLGNPNPAKENYDAALKINPNDARALIGSGLAAHRMGNLPSAIQQYRKAVANAPSDLAYELLGRALAQSGHSTDAQQSFQKADQLSSDPKAMRAFVDHLLAH
jgi:tetratricopeptide (TPR) repeat protein